MLRNSGHRAGRRAPQSRMAIGLAAAGAAILLAASPALGQDGASVVARANAIEQRKPVRFDIAPQPLASAIVAFSRAADVDLVFDGPIPEGATTRGVTGVMPPAEALSRLLEGLSLQAAMTGPRTITLLRTQAGGAPDTIQLQEINVEGAGEGVDGRPESATGPVRGYVATRSATGSKTDTPILEIPQSVSVVTRDQIERQGAVRLEDALTYTPGVTVGSYGSNPEQDYVFSRGFQVPLFIDGIRQERDYITGAQMGVEPYGFERIEVLRGPSSVLYGQISPGGLVNQISKRPTEDPFREIQVQAGTRDRIQAAFDLSGPANDSGTVLYRLTGLARNADGQMDFQGDDRLFLAPAVTFRPSDDTTITLLAQLQHDRDALRPVPLPAEGTLFSNPNGKLPTGRFLGDPDFDAFKRNQYAFGYDFAHRFNEVFSFRQYLRYTRLEQTEKYTLTDFFTDFPNDLRTVGRTAWDDRNKISALGVDNQALAEFSTGPLSHNLIVGLDYRRATNDWTFDSAPMTPIDAFDPVYGDPFTGPFERFIDQTEKRRQTGLYVQDQIRFDRWSLTVGGRQDWAEASVDDNLFDSRFKQKDDDFTGRVGLAYLFDSGFTPYASYSESFDPETAARDRNGNAFKPSTAQQYEVGVKYQPAGSRSFVALSLFDLTRQNVVTYDGTFTPFQTGEVNIKGVEVEAKLQLTDGLNVIGAYTYFDSKITKSERVTDVGRPFFFTPKHQFALWGDYALPGEALKGFGIGAGVRHRSSVYGLLYEIKTPSYTVADASFTYDFGARSESLKGLKLTVAARNLFDRKYLSTCSFTEGCFYGDRRTALATLAYRW